METILSNKAEVYNHQGYLVSSGISVSIVDKEYIRVGSFLYWRHDLIENENELECLASGAKIKLK